MKTRNCLVISYDWMTYENKQFIPIVEEFKEDADIELKELHQKALGEYPIIVLLLIGPPIYWFSKAFFTRLGEKCADILFDRKSDQNPQLAVSFVPENDSEIRIFINPKKKEQIKDNMIDKKIREIYDKISSYIKENKDKNIEQFTVAVDEKIENIERLYFIDQNKNIYGGKKPINKKATN